MVTECKICNNKYKRILSHIVNEHGLSKEEYYIKYIDKNAGKCKVCGKPTVMKELYRGFNEYCSKKCSSTPYLRATDIEIIDESNPYKTCPYCAKDYSNISYHVQAKHKINIKDYYDYFIDDYKSFNNICPICKKERLEFLSLSYGYLNTCSSRECKEEFNRLQASKSNTIDYIDIESLKAKYDNSEDKEHKCVYCGSFYNKLSIHLKRVHKVKIDEYYLKYINPKAITKCVICKKPTRFGDISNGFFTTCSHSCNNKNRHRKYLNSNIDIMDESVYYKKHSLEDIDYTRVCSVCGNVFESLSNHLKYSHNINPKDYYDTIVSKSKPELCIVCGKNERIFNGIVHGYSVTCGECIGESSYSKFYLVEDNSILLRSSLEYVFYLMLVEYNIDFTYEDREYSIKYLGLDGKYHIYIPDFYLPKYNTVVEIKPKYAHGDSTVLLKKYEYIRQRPDLNYRILDTTDYQNFFDDIGKKHG